MNQHTCDILAVQVAEAEKEVNKWQTEVFVAKSRQKLAWERLKYARLNHRDLLEGLKEALDALPAKDTDTTGCPQGELSPSTPGDPAVAADWLKPMTLNIRTIG